MKKAYQTSSLGVPLKHLGVREFTEMEWDRLMAWYKSRKVKIRWVLVKEDKPPKRRRKEPDLEARAQDMVNKEFPDTEVSETVVSDKNEVLTKDAGSDAP